MNRSLFISHALIPVLLVLVGRASAQDASDVTEENFTEALFHKSLKRTESALRGFRDLTRLMAKGSNRPDTKKTGFFYVHRIPKKDTITVTLTGEQLSGFPILNWDMQNIGFPYLITGLKGCGYVAQKRIRKLELENARLRDAPADEVKRLEWALASSEQRLEAFLAESRWSD